MQLNPTLQHSETPPLQPAMRSTGLTGKVMAAPAGLEDVFVAVTVARRKRESGVRA